VVFWQSATPLGQPLLDHDSQLAQTGVSYNAGVVKYFFPTLLHPLRDERHFALVEISAIPTQARLVFQQPQAISLRRKSRVTHLESKKVRNALSSLWVGRRPMSNSEPGREGRCW
jgi:hypothetical protein